MSSNELLVKRARGPLGWSHLLILAIPVVLVCLPFWPGHMNADTLHEIDEVITGKLTDYHAPLLLGPWHLVWGLGVGPGWVLVAQVCCFVLGVYLVMRIAFGPVGAAVAASVIALLPQDYGELGLVGRDTWYTALLMLAAGALAYGFAAASPRSPRVRRTALTISMCAAWLALAARQNAVTSVVALIGAALALLLVRRWPLPASHLRGRLARLAIVAGGAIVITLAFYASQSGLSAAIGVHQVHPEQYIYDFDLAGMSTRENRDLFPASIVPPSRLADIKRLFTLDDVTPEIVAPGAPLPVAMLNGTQVAAERRAEINAVTGSPFVWFGLHWDEFLRQISITRDANVVIHPGIDGNPFGLHSGFPKLDSAARSYVEAFDATSVPEPEGGVIFTVWIYLLFAALGAWFLLPRWREPRALVLGALALSSLTYQLGAFLSMGVQYRLELPSVVTGMVVVVAGGRMLIVRGLRRTDWIAAR